MTQRIIERIEALKEQIYYVDNIPNFVPFGQRVNDALDNAISIIREETEREVSDEDLNELANALMESGTVEDGYYHSFPSDYEEIVNVVIKAIKAMKGNV